MDGAEEKGGVHYFIQYITNLAKLFCHQRLNRLKDYFFHVLSMCIEMKKKKKTSVLAFEIINLRYKFLIRKLGSSTSLFHLV